MKNKRFKYYQPNDKDLKDEYGDCVVRSLTKALNKDWFSVYDDLVVIARELQAMPNTKISYEQYLKQNGFEYTGISNRKGTKRPTVESFTKENHDGVYVMVVANHLVTCVDGIYYDTFDSGFKSMYGYWNKEVRI